MPIALDESSSGRAASAPIQLQKAQETRAIHLAFLLRHQRQPKYGGM
jgi:hypothetical protein